MEVQEYVPETVEYSTGGGGLGPESITDAESATNAIGQCARMLGRAGAVLRGADTGDPLAYRLARGVWVEIHETPASDNGVTVAPAPAGKEQFEAMVQSEDWLGLINAAEDAFIESPLWLDPHRYLALAMDRGGPMFLKARKIVLRELATLLLRAPGLVDLQFNDGTPVADVETKAWIDADVKSAVGSGGGGAADPLAMPIAQARGMVAAGNLADALALLATATTGVSSSADRFRGRLASAQVCLEAHQYAIARAQLEGLDRLLEYHRLAEWDPGLGSQFYAALYAAHRGVNLAMGGEVPPEARAKEQAAFERLCQLDPGTALKLTAVAE